MTAYSLETWRRACERSQHRSNVLRAEARPTHRRLFLLLAFLTILLTLLGSFLAAGWLPAR